MVWCGMKLGRRVDGVVVKGRGGMVVNARLGGGGGSIGRGSVVTGDGCGR